LTSKARAALRAQAHHLTPAVQVGRAGITEALRQSLDDALRTRELVKIQFLKEAGLELKTAAADLAREMGAEIVQLIGRTATMYRENPEQRR
jgi:RNA-binding protein